MKPSSPIERGDFESQLKDVLPADLPHRENVVRESARHLALIAEVNQHLNLTRIATPRDAAVKHVLDSVLPWRLFEGSKRVLDAGTGAGFPGIPLALALPEIHFTLAESVRKKARFVESALAAISLPNVSVSSRRAEDLLKTEAIDTITARAFAPLSRTLELLGPALKRGARALLYKGPDAEMEIAGAEREATKLLASVRVVMRYDLPDSLGVRTIIEVNVEQGFRLLISEENKQAKAPASHKLINHAEPCAARRLCPAGPLHRDQPRLSDSRVGLADRRLFRSAPPGQRAGIRNQLLRFPD